MAEKRPWLRGRRSQYRRSLVPLRRTLEGVSEREHVRFTNRTLALDDCACLLESFAENRLPKRNALPNFLLRMLGEKVGQFSEMLLVNSLAN
jgi:hypothetical protein